MPILTANINFLASLGITTSEQFTAAFGDMADFTEYCTAIGYSWELDENNDIILITPDGKKVNTYVPAEESEKTATPKIVVTPGNTEYTFEAIGDGDVKLYIDETEVSNPVAISRTSEAQEVTVTATAQEQGKQISDEAWEEVTIPALTGPTSIQFDSESYSISGVEYDPSLKENFTITDNLGNYVNPSDCTFTLYPNNTGLNISIGRTNCFDATEMSAGSYTITVTATYEGMTATATVNADIAAPVPQSISFDSNTYTITANEGEMNTTPFVVEDDLGNDVTVSCTYSFSPNNTGIFVDDMGATDRAFNTQYMTAGAYTVTVTATYEGLTATATLDISIDAPVAEDIYFDSDSYSLTGTVGDPGLQQSFSVTDDLGNDVTSDCTITLYPNNTGIIVSGSLIDATSMSEGVYHITMTATYEGLTATSTIDVDIAAPIPQSISFDSNSYSISGPEGDPSLTQPFTVEDDLGNDVTMDCSFDCNPDDGLNVLNGEFDATIMPEGTYSTTVTATYGELTATATVDIDITAPVLSSIEFDRSTYTLTAEEGEDPGYAFAVYDNLGNDVTSDCNYYLSPDNTGLWVEAPGVFHLSQMTEGTYSVNMTAEYIDGSDTYTASATVDVEITAPAQIPDYLKLTVLPSSGRFDDNITITIPASVTPTQATSLSYSYDGSNWTDTAVDSTAQTITIPVSVGNEVYLKGIANQWSTGLGLTTKINSARMNFAVSGNVMSLFYGDNFENQTSFPTNSTHNLNELFKDNTHLIDASQLELPATTLATSCYSGMFNGCTSLTTTPAILPATTLANSCYYNTFNGCTSLTSAPELPATTLAQSCYSGMFNGCTSLTSAPELPATTLAVNCYRWMFKDCTSLTTAPELPATTLAQNCYQEMFYGCTSLNSITMLAVNISAMNCLNNWVGGVAATGTFIKAPTANIPSGVNGIPTGWTVDEYGPKYLKMHIDNAPNGNEKIYVSIPSTSEGIDATSFGYSKDKVNWTEVEVGNSSQDIQIPVTTGDNVYFKGIANRWCNGNEEELYNLIIGCDAFCSISGNIMSMLYGDNFEDQTSFPSGSSYNLAYMFHGSGLPNLTDASHLELPATDLADSCYSGMFFNCSSLTAAPELPATTLATNCYGYMFMNCTSLTSAPELPATDLADSCYRMMFNGCTSLTSAPELPATDLADSCYRQMFQGCTSLTAAPELPATTLAQNCYYYMFMNCSALTAAPELPATDLANICYFAMFYGCTSLTTAPELPATTLTSNCYSYMFGGCSSLNSITMLAEDISASNCLNNWVQNVAATGTFTKSANMTTLPTGDSGIPTNWTVVDYTP